MIAAESHDDVVNCPGLYYIETVDKEMNNIQVRFITKEQIWAKNGFCYKYF